MQFPTNKKRVLSVFSLAMINVIAIDSLRNLPTNAENGWLIIFFYFIGTLFFVLPCILITAELSTRYPKTGGSYIWVREAFGEQCGFFTIWLLWIYNVIWYPTILSFIAASVAYLINPALAADKFFMVSMVIVMFFAATIANFFGMKTSSLISSLGAIIGTILPMICIIVLGIVWLALKKPLAIPFETKALLPSVSSFKDIAFLVIVFFSLMGFEMSAAHAEEVENPSRDFPRALIYSAVIVVISAIFASLAIAIIVPKSDLSLVSGLNQAFLYFLQAYHLQWLMPVVTLCIILGGFAGIAAWAIGPTKGLMVAAQDGSLPKILRKQNKKGVPISILISQFIIVVLLCGLFLFFKSINTSYWILSDLTGQLALIYYLLFFAGAIRLRYKNSGELNAYRIPGKNIGMWIAGLTGFLVCIIVFLLGFLPPKDLIQSDLSYELILIIGILIFSLPPLIIYRVQKKKCNYSAQC